MQDPMYSLKKGDRIVCRKTQEASNSTIIITEEVLARLEDIVFTRKVNVNSVGPLNEPQLIEDLITYGFQKEEE